MYIYLRLLFFLTSLLEYNCFTMLCQFLLYNKVKQLYVYIYPYIPSPSPSLSHPSRWSQSTQLISLCYAAASHQLSVLNLVVYICQCHTLTSSQLNNPPSNVLKSILYVCVFILVLPQGSSQTFFFLHSIYMCWNTVFVYLFLTSLCMTDSRSIHLTTNNSIFFFF